ncbi:hypothetical protein Leryth_018759 [Lithospermum erythrorhizon]|nr:hypothetical protein Leryth_018759 [Lithospermum erythrorhizon]
MTSKQVVFSVPVALSSVHSSGKLQLPSLFAPEPPSSICLFLLFRQDSLMCNITALLILRSRFKWLCSCPHRLRSVSRDISSDDLSVDHPIDSMELSSESMFPPLLELRVSSPPSPISAI